MNSSYLLKTLVISQLFFVGCASLKATIPYSKVLTPEVKSERLQFSLDVINLKRTAQYEISSDASKRPFVEDEFTEFEDDESKAFWVGGDIQVFDRFELGLSFGQVTELRAKYQLIGDTLNQSQAGNQSLALFTTFSSSSNSNSGDQNGVFGVGGHDWKARANSTNNAVGLSYGYRLKENLLLYTGLTSGRIDVSGEVIHDESDDKTSPKAQYDIDHKTGSERTLAGGVVFSYNNWNLDVSLNNSKIELDDVVKSESYGLVRATYIFGNESPQQKPDIDPANPFVQPTLIPKESWQLRDFVAIASSYVVGFGTGQAIQNRWSDSGMNFAIADGSALAILLYGLTSCSYSSNCSNGAGTATTGILILAVSRVWQIVDTIVDANSTYTKTNSSIYFVPTQEGAQLTYAHRF